MKYGDILLIKPKNRVNPIKVRFLTEKKRLWNNDIFIELLDNSSCFESSYSLYFYSIPIFMKNTKNKIRRVKKDDFELIKYIKKLEEIK